MEYQHFSTDEFVLDEYFQQWVFGNSPEVARFWDEFIVNYPDIKQEVVEARRILQVIHFKEYEPTPESYCRVKENINTNLDAKGKIVFLSQSWQKAAAAVAGILLVCSFLLYYFVTLPIVHQTAYNETKTVWLPDSSKVVLNANSTLRYGKNWIRKNMEEREVWVEGEAYFEIRKQQRQTKERHVPFTVHAAGLDVVVLGTVFNVNSRRDKTQVVLSSGKVKIEPADKQEPLFMQPGEMVELARNSQNLVQKVVNPEHYTSWQEQIYYFENTSLEEIAQVIEDQFGRPVRINNDSIANLKFTAKVPMKDMDDLLILLSETFGLEIKEENSKILIKKPD